MAGEKVLVIDDHKDSVEFVVDCVLVPNGYRPLTARDGEEGLHKALTEEPDLILLDLQMPKMSGAEVLEALREAGSHIPILLMTFHGSEELAARVFRLVVKNYVIKPFQVEEMLEAIEGALAEVRLRREKERLTANLIQLNRQLDRRVKELSILYGIGKSVSSLLNPEKLLERIVEAAVYITGAEEGSLLLLDVAKEELFVGAAQGLDERYTHLFRLKVEGSIAGEVVKTGQPVALSGAIEVGTDYKVKALLNTPLKLKGQVMGVLGVYNRVADRPFTADDLYLLSGLSDYAAIAIENAQLFDKAQHRVQELTFLTEIGRAVTSTLNLQQVLAMILEEACRVLEVDIASILLLDDETGELIFEMAVGPEGAELQGVRLPPGQGVAGCVADHGQPLIVSEARADPRFYPAIDELINFYTESILCVPLKIKDRVIGVVEVLNKAGRGFTEDDLRLLSSLAASAAIAIENAQLFDALQELREREEGCIRNLFQHYLAPAVVDRLLSDSEQTILGGRRQEITALFADIRGFTALSEKISPENLVGVLNQYLSLPWLLKPCWIMGGPWTSSWATRSWLSSTRLWLRRTTPCRR